MAVPLPRPRSSSLRRRRKSQKTTRRPNPGRKTIERAALADRARERLQNPTLEEVAALFDVLRIDLQRAPDGASFSGKGTIPIPPEDGGWLGEVWEEGPRGLYPNLTGLRFEIRVVM